MFDAEMSEREQIEALGKWWSNYGKYLLYAVIIGVLLGSGWKYWQNMQLRYNENASVIYQSVYTLNEEKKFADAKRGAELLIQKFPKTPYASLGALMLAKDAVSANHLSEALMHLQWVIDHSKLPRLRQVARIDAARILLSDGKTAQATTLLSVVDDKSFLPMVNWVRGDIAMKMKDVKTARENYVAAKTALSDMPQAQAVLTQLSAN